MTTYLNFLIVGLLVYVILRMHTMSIELTWMRRYMVRLLTDQFNAHTPSEEPATEIGLEEFDGEDIHHPMSVAPENVDMPTTNFMHMSNFADYLGSDDDTRVVEVDGSVDFEDDRQSDAEELRDDETNTQETDQEEDVPP